MTRYLLERALLPEGVVDDVEVEIDAGRFVEVRTDAAPTADVERLGGLSVPGLANGHSHAFHRALRGHTQAERGTFWTWRERMYAVAARLDPDRYHALARACFAEMLAAGYTTVGEFHYLHHQPDGTPYADPNALGEAVLAAAGEMGLRITLLDTCYLSAGFGDPLEGVQRRFGDGDAGRWAARVEALTDGPGRRIGVAVHSVRAVPADQLATVVAAGHGRPLHAHLSEQTAENERCLAVTGRTPTALLADHGALGPDTTLVHATHLTDDDIGAIGSASSWACFCPTTERDLGDGIGPSRALHAAGARLSIGSDSQAVIDPFEEMRAVELDERLATRERGHWSASELLAAGTAHAALGWPDAGRIEAGARADLVVLDADSPALAGTGRDAEAIVFAAGAADVVQTMVDGVVRYRRGDDVEIARALDRAVAEVQEDV